MRPKTLIVIILSLLILAMSLFYLSNLRRRVSELERRYVSLEEEKKPSPRKKVPVLPVAAAPVITKRYSSPKVAIVMDDFGYNMNNLDTFFDIKEPVTLSILPNQPYSQRIAELAAARGYEVILHLPMEPHKKDGTEERGTINSAMSEEGVRAILVADMKSVPGLKGVSNHMGSKATEEMGLMSVIMKELKPRDLYFFDSLTSTRSVCRQAAAAAGVKYARRDIFLDNDNNINAIKREMMKLRKLAFKNGAVIAICHDRPNTIKALAETMPQFASEGITFVRLSEMEK
ncbi:MAG: divergent polysaccharide deacetylase family protein [Candidatus Omnitrophica bacterium]|nr:divergent polysaccharide deacetylase family protein [Candidatus Omnitrophota bacterium]